MHTPTVPKLQELRRRLGAAKRALLSPSKAPEPRALLANSDPSRYEPTWSPPTLAEAKRLIYCTESEESFDEGGRADYEYLTPFLTEGRTVALDLGCGIGRVAKFVAPHCAKLWAVDVSQRMLDYAAERLSEFQHIQYVHGGDVKVPGIPDNSVDLIYSFLVLQHLEREDAFVLMRELRRLIASEGRVVLTFPNLLSDVYLYSFVSYANRRAATEPGRARMYTPQEVERLVSAAGFEVESISAETEIRVVGKPGPENRWTGVF
jgi:SAM-dependent methyltransferase